MKEEAWILVFIPVYFIIGAIVNGLMHRYDHQTFDCSATQVALVIFWWPFLIPIYWFWILCDRCILWFEKKK